MDSLRYREGAHVAVVVVVVGVGVARVVGAQEEDSSQRAN